MTEFMKTVLRLRTKKKPYELDFTTLKGLKITPNDEEK